MRQVAVAPARHDDESDGEDQAERGEESDFDGSEHDGGRCGWPRGEERPEGFRTIAAGRSIGREGARNKSRAPPGRDGSSHPSQLQEWGLQMIEALEGRCSAKRR